MKEKIKELRVKIDGLAQLTRNLRPQYLYKLDVAKLPDGWDIENWLKVFKERGFVIEDSFNQSSKYLTVEEVSKPILESIPQIHKEIDNATDSLYLAKAWLGKVLYELGDETPYKNDGNRKEIKDIEGVADKEDLSKRGEDWDYIDINFNTATHIEKVDWLREKIKNITDLVEYRKINLTSTEKLKEKGIYCITNLLEFSMLNTIKYLCEARFWLGFELQRIKENESSK